MTGFMGRDHVYVVAEVGANHGGSLDAAIALIDAAADAGADAAKFQAGHADHVYDPSQFPEEHASFKKYVEPVLSWLPQLAQKCQQRGIDFGCSAFCYDALDAVDPYVKWHKVASIEATWNKFLFAVARKQKPVVISTGATTGQDVAMALMPLAGLREVIVMQCAVAYPADLNEADLHAMLAPRRLRDGNGNYIVDGSPRWKFGLSDHTTHPTIAPCAAVALGASVIEKHIRGQKPWDVGLDPRPPPPDWTHSITPSQFREMVDAIRLTEKALGSSEKRIRESEKPYLRYRRGPRGLRGA